MQRHHVPCLIFLASSVAVPMRTLAQEPSENLREHIVHTVNATGLDEYRDDRIPTIPDTTICFVYVGRKQNGAIWLRLQVRYSSYKRLDMRQITFRKDDRQLVMELMPELVHWGDNGIVNWEWYDSPPGENELKAIRAIINEPGVTLTIVGKDTVTRELSETERLAMANVMEQYTVLAHGR